jgi:hypothetical protein
MLRTRALHSFMAAFSQEQATLRHTLLSRYALVNAGCRRESRYYSPDMSGCRRGLHLSETSFSNGADCMFH